MTTQEAGPGAPGAPQPERDGAVAAEVLPVRQEPEPSALPAVVETAATAVAAREKAAVEARFLMALKRPRNPDQARVNILAACRRPRFAASVQYKKPVGKEYVFGLSIRFAEEAARLWGNLDVQAIIVFDDRERRIYRVTGTDLETNATEHRDVMIEKTVERKHPKQGDEVIGKRVNSKGETVYLKAATEDEIFTKANAQLSKARRNVILPLIPSDIRDEAEEVALATVKERDAKDPAGARKDILDAFFLLGVTPDQVKSLIGKPLEQINPGELQLLRSIYTSIRDGEATWAEVESDEGLARMRAANSGGETGTKKPGKGMEGLRDAVGPKDPKASPPAGAGGGQPEVDTVK